MTVKPSRINFVDYYRLTKPGIIRGNIINTAAGFLLASRWNFGVGLLAAMLAGTVLIIASSCVLNNYIDRGIDAKMVRTKNRGLVSGEVSVKSALIFAVLLGVLGFGLLAVFTNALTVAIGAFAMFMYVIVYGYAKRKSVHGTLIGSISGALPPVAGYAAAVNRLDTGALLLFLILVCWQMPHFYAIAIYRFKDYKAAGLPVLPVKSGLRTTKIQILFYIAAFIFAMLLLTVFGYAGYTFAIVMSAIGFYWLVKGVAGFSAADDTKWAHQMFGTSLIVVMVLAVMLSIGPLLP